jgi:hypothetical protein
LAKAAQTGFALTSQSGTFGTPLTLTTTGGAGTGAVSYTVTNGTATGCTITATAPFKLTSTSRGTCFVTATKAADANFLASTTPATGVTLG